MAVGVAAEVKSRLNVVDVVGETVQLKKAGTTFKGLCPFHGEKTPSLRRHARPARAGTASAAAWAATSSASSCSATASAFPEALKQLAARAGVELDERTSRDDARKRRLRDVLESAIAFYHTVLTAHPSGRTALDYLRERGFTDETIETHQLGWAPGGWETMSKQLQAKREVTPPGARGGRADPAAGERAGRRLRPVPGADHLPDPGPGRERGRARRPVPRGAEGDDAATTVRSTSTRRPPRCSTRAGRCTSSTAPRARSARPVRRSSSRATRTR